MANGKSVRVRFKKQTAKTIISTNVIFSAVAIVLDAIILCVSVLL
jgi:hypothetical protein